MGWTHLRRLPLEDFHLEARPLIEHLRLQQRVRWQALDVHHLRLINIMHIQPSPLAHWLRDLDLLHLVIHCLLILLLLAAVSSSRVVTADHVAKTITTDREGCTGGLLGELVEEGTEARALCRVVVPLHYEFIRDAQATTKLNHHFA